MYFILILERYFFELEQCENAVVEGLTIINCNKNNTVTPVKLELLAPDLIMSDFFGRRIEYCGILFWLFGCLVFFFFFFLVVDCL
jgi:hypothetical protein